MAKITFKQLAAQKRHIKVKLPGIDETLDVSYIPGKITPRFWAALNEQIHAENGITLSQSKVLQVCEFVSDWSIVDEDGNSLPVTQDVVDQLPTPLLDAILAQINEDLYPPDDNSKKS